MGVGIDSVRRAMFVEDFSSDGKFRLAEFVLSVKCDAHSKL
jgi:hypothetical protein